MRAPFFILFERVDREPSTNLVVRGQLDNVQHEVHMHAIMTVILAGMQN